MNDIDKVFKQFPVMETENLVLRKILLSDRAEIFAIYSDPEAMKYFGKYPHKTLIEADGMIYKVINAFQNGEGIRWGVALKNSNKLAGTAGIWRIDRKHFRGEIGYDLMPKYWRKGIMTEALRAIVDFGFSEMKLHTIEANADPNNIASTKLLEKLGFKKEGHLKESYFFDGKFTDNVIYSKINPEG